MDVLHGDGLPSPCVVDQKLRVHTELPVEGLLVCLRDPAHGADPETLKPGSRPFPDAPEIRERLVIPERLAVGFLVQYPDEIVCVLGCDVQRDLGQIQVRTDPAGGTHPDASGHLVHQEQRHLFRRLPVPLQIARNVQKGLVDGIDVDVLRGDVSDIDAVDLRRVIDVLLHPWRRHDVIDPLGDLEDAAAVAHAQRLHGRRDRQTDGLFRARRIRHDQIRGHGIQAPFDTLD